MSGARKQSVQHLSSLVLVICSVSFSQAAGWFDNFNDGSTTDGNPVMWLEDLGGSGFFPGRYDASSGDYVLDPDDFSPTGQMSALVPAVSFTNTYIRAQGKVLPDPAFPEFYAGNFVLTARINPAALTGYLVYFDADANLNLQILEPGPGGQVTTRDLATTFDAPFNARSEVVVELNVVGNQLSAYAWLADDPNGKPETPQVTATDSTYASGIAGVAFSEDDPGTSVVYRYAAAQDTPFVDALAGDFNGDDRVDAADYVVWRNGEQGGTFDQDDYNAWRMNFGSSAGSGSLVGSAVPEPGALVQLLVAVASVLRIAVRRRGSTS
jgi:hypothetical protein